MTTKSKVVLTVIIAVTATCFITYKSSLVSDATSRVAVIDHLFGDPDQARDQVAALHEARRREVMRQCQARPEHYYTNSVPESVSAQLLHRFLVDEKHHLAFCYVPKNGCSLWKRVFFILSGRKAGKAVFNLSSTAIHSTKVLKHLEGNFFQMYHSLQSSKKALFVRDPYERLFSGYVDKYFSPCIFGHDTIISRFRLPKVGPAECQPGLNFTEFLRYVTNTKGVSVNEHFRRQYLSCLPCHVPYDYIGKMETFRQDVEFILGSVNVDPSLVLGPEDSVEESSDLNILHDVIERSFRLCKRSRSKCVSKHDMMLRVWVTFQIRGFLSIHGKFPLSVSEAKRTTLQQFQALVKAAYRQSGDRSVVKRQRQLALQEAYHSVPRSLLAEVQRYVAEDCELFGYDCSIESRFNVSNKPEPVFHVDDILLKKSM